MCVCVHVCAYVCAHTCVCLCLYLCLSLYVHMCVSIYECISVCLCVSVPVLVFVHAYVCMCLHVCVHWACTSPVQQWYMRVCYHPRSAVGVENLNSGPPACTAGTLPAEPSSQGPLGRLSEHLHLLLLGPAVCVTLSSSVHRLDYFAFLCTMGITRALGARTHNFQLFKYKEDFLAHTTCSINSLTITLDSLNMC